MPQTELTSANRVAFLEQLSASIAEINQPICAVVMGAEAALRLLLAQPTDTEAVRRLLARQGRNAHWRHRSPHLCADQRKRRCGGECLEINAVTLEAIDITHDELVMNGVSRAASSRINLNLMGKSAWAATSQVSHARRLRDPWSR
jgi:C4-dicarboxylate-specific signal transduction histidine kinase